ncbi:DUF4097 domain-containing protein [Alteribacillus sp. JSM 102045]|uniref:DUF4097 family beta strand repeat-containing protein n=1 Tax=Alteribacillus sp. JSM 102045 TaxID=1562101 RepID=UPI0035C0CF41
MVTIPETFDGHLLINGGSSNVRFENEEEKMLKSLQTDIASGDIRIKHVKAEEIDMSAKSGNLTLNEIEVEKAALHTISGDIKIDRYSGPLNADLTSGDLYAQWDKMKNGVHINVTSGDVDLKVEEEELKLDISVVSGDIRNEVRLDNIEKSGKRSLIGQKGEGEVSVNIESISGDIHIEE